MSEERDEKFVEYFRGKIWNAIGVVYFKNAVEKVHFQRSSHDNRSIDNPVMNYYGHSVPSSELLISVEFSIGSIIGRDSWGFLEYLEVSGCLRNMVPVEAMILQASSIESGNISE